MINPKSVLSEYCLLAEEMLEMINKINLWRPGKPTEPLVLQAARMVGCARRTIAFHGSGSIHADLRVAAEAEQFHFRWSSSAVLTSDFLRFRKEALAVVASLEEWLGARQLARLRSARGKANRQPALRAV